MLFLCSIVFNHWYRFTAGVLAHLTEEILPGSGVSCIVIARNSVISAAIGSASTCNLCPKLIIISGVWSGRQASVATKLHLTMLSVQLPFQQTWVKRLHCIYLPFLPF